MHRSTATTVIGAVTVSALAMGTTATHAADVTVTTGAGVGADIRLEGDEPKPDEPDPTNDRAGQDNIFLQNWSSPGFDRMGYIRFDVRNEMDLDAGEFLTGGSIKLNSVSHTPNTEGNQDVNEFVGLEVWGLQDGVPGDAAPSNGGWAEDKIWYDTAPGKTEGVDFNSEATRLIADRFTDDHNSAFEPPQTFDSSDFDSFLANDTNGLVTLMVRPLVESPEEDQDNIALSTKEATTDDPNRFVDPPTLNVTTAIPEPASLTLLGLGATFALPRRRR